MRRLDLELIEHPKRRTALLFVVAGAAVAFAASQYDASDRHRMPLVTAPAPQVAKADPADSEAYRTAAETVRRLAAPWDRLFDALEAAQTSGVTLASVEPDVQSGALAISGESRDYLSVLTYVARLGEQRALSRAHLLKHELRPKGTMSFTVSAHWLPDAEMKQVSARGLSAFYAQLERKETKDEWLAKLHGLAAASGLELRSAQYRLAGTRHRIERYEITLPVQGGYAQVRRFLDAALAEIPLLSLDRASFRRKPGDTRIEAELMVTLHMVRL